MTDKAASEAAAALARIPSAKRTAARTAVMQAINTRREPKACTCGQEPHKPGCVVYHREVQRRSRERAKLAKEHAPCDMS